MILPEGITILCISRIRSAFWSVRITVYDTVNPNKVLFWVMMFIVMMMTMMNKESGSINML